MSNTAPSKADPVVVFPLSQWCPPQETSEHHPPQHNFKSSFYIKNKFKLQHQQNSVFLCTSSQLLVICACHNNLEKMFSFSGMLDHALLLTISRLTVSCTWGPFHYQMVTSQWTLMQESTRHCAIRQLITIANRYHWIHHETSNISHTLVSNKIVDHSDVVGASLSALLQLHLHSRLNTWLQ